MKVALSGLLLLVLAVPSRGADAAADAAAGQFFETKIRPVLVERCLRCHGDEGGKTESGLRLTSRASVLGGGDRGPAIVAEKPDESLLIKAIRYTDADLRMPPDKRLESSVIADFERWVTMGAVWPGGEDSPQPARPRGPKQITEEDRNYWAYRRVERPLVPAATKDDPWAATPIDAFLLARLREAELEPNPPATKRQLIRRAFFDLIGLPPTPQEVDAFLADDSPEAWERLIDDLLSRPQYGEKWGRHWLDLVRYAETNGYERDGTKPNAWRYRDYVIDSFNQDKPFDRFIIEQLAGDEMDDRSRETTIATGFMRLGLWQDEPVDFEQNYYEQLDDVVRTTAEAFLGTTLGCARCHDHKADPVLHTDYYRFLAFFHGLEPYSRTRDATSPFNQTEISEPAVVAEVERIEKEVDGPTAELRQIEDTLLARLPENERPGNDKQRIEAVKKSLENHSTADERTRHAELVAQREQLEKERNALPRKFALSVNHCRAAPPETFVLLRGNASAKAEQVEPGFPQVLGFDDPRFSEPSEGARTPNRRMVLAKWIASPENPLTARVVANRLWQHHFGRGIVPTPNDFGRLGTPPSHPELLDWLASEVVANGWRLKDMHRLIMTSSAYQMSSAPAEQGLARDPANELFWRFNMRRLTAEELRDSVLAVNGTLNLEMGGPSIYTVVPDSVLQTASQPDQAWGTSPPTQQVRRSVYIFIKRSLVEPVLAAFDYPDTDASAAERFVTTVPTQSLTTLNGSFFNREAQLLAERLDREAGGDPAAQVRLAFRLAVSRDPTPEEVENAVGLMESWQSADVLSRDQALKNFCLLMYNLNEFLYLE